MADQRGLRRTEWNKNELTAEYNRKCIKDVRRMKTSIKAILFIPMDVI